MTGIGQIDTNTTAPKAERRSPASAEFRDAQRKLWDQDAAGWRKWSSFIDQGATKLSEHLVQLAGVTDGSRVVDIACGYGEPTLSAAKVAGPEGRVVATDISAGMIAYGRERVSAAGLTNVDFVVSDASSLEFPEHSFDAAVSRFGLIFEPEAETVARKVQQFLKPEGRISLASWASPDRVPFLGIPLMTALRELAVPPPPKGTPGPFARPTVESLGDLLRAGGFSDIATEEFDVTFVWPSIDNYILFIKETVPPLTALLSQHAPEAQSRVWSAITDAIGRFANPDGVTLVNRAIVASGTA